MPPKSQKTVSLNGVLDTPYELIFYSGFKNRQDAINCEKYFKTTAGWKRLHRMLENTLKFTL